MQFSQKKFLNKYICEYKFTLGALLIGIIGSSFIGLFYPLVTAKIINQAFYEGSTREILKYFFLFIIIFIVHRVFHFIRCYFAAKLQGTFTVKIKKTIFNSIMSFKGKNYEAYNTGDLIMRMGDDADQILNNIYYNIFYSIADVVEFVVQLVFILLLSFPIFIFTLISMPFSFYLTRYFMKKSEKYYQQLKNSRSVLSSWIFEVVQGIQELRNIRGKSWMDMSFEKWNTDYNEGQKNVNICQMRNKQIVEGVSLVIHIILYLLSAVLISLGHLKLGNFIAVVEYFNASIGIFKDLAEKGNPMANGIVAMKRIMEVINMEKEEESNEITVVEGEISANNCSFKYNEIFVLQDLNLTIKPNTTLALVGENGSGKTTFVQLIMGIYDASKGDIKIDRQSIKEYSKNSLRKQIAIVYQEVALFEGNVRYNISFGNKDLNDDEIWDYLKMVGLFEHFKELPFGLDTILGTEGIGLSGGQRQRIGIARALAKKTKIIIFDESTSALDKESEASIKDIWKKLSGKKTIIIIAHKLDTICDANDIVMLEHGKMVGRGSHQEMLQNCKQYVKLFVR